MALPLLDAMRLPLRAAGDPARAVKRRMVCINTPLGLHPANFFPTETGRDYKLSKYLEVVGEFRQGPAIVDLRLGPLDLELVQDPGQLGDLLLVQVELVGEEPQWPPDAEARTGLEPIPLVVMVAVARHEPSSWLTMIVMSVVLMRLSAIVLVMGMRMDGLTVALGAP